LPAAIYALLMHLTRFLGELYHSHLITRL